MAKIHKKDKTINIGYGDLIQFTNYSDKDKIFIVMRDNIINLEDVFDIRGSFYPGTTIEGVKKSIENGSIKRLESGTKITLTQE